jgi:hypothetical protein
VISLVAVVFACMAITVAMADPAWAEVLAGFVPNTRTVIDPGVLYIAIGIIGASVMPHNLYLHSSIVRTRRIAPGERRFALTYACIDIVVAMLLAFVINASILVTAGAAFHANGQRDVAELQDAGFAPDARKPSADPVRAGGRSSLSRIGRGRPSLRRQRLAADAAGDAVVPLLVLPVAPVVPGVPSPVLLQADRASAAVSAHAREEN